MEETAALELVSNWYKKIDEHAPAVDIMAFVDFRSFRIENDSICVNSPEDFGKWYVQLTGMFFDECHTILESKTWREGESVFVWVRVNAKGRMWQAPAAKSTMMEFDTAQIFQVGEIDGKPVMIGFVTEYMKRVDSSGS